MNETFSGSTILYDRIEYYYEAEGDAIRTFIDENKDRRLDQLFALYNQLFGEAPLEEEEEAAAREKAREMELEVTRILIAKELDVTTLSHTHYLIDRIEEFRQSTIETQRNTQELRDRFHNHRHNKGPSYSEKPVY